MISNYHKFVKDVAQTNLFGTFLFKMLTPVIFNLILHIRRVLHKIQIKRYIKREQCFSKMLFFSSKCCLIIDFNILFLWFKSTLTCLKVSLTFFFEVDIDHFWSSKYELEVMLCIVVSIFFNKCIVSHQNLLAIFDLPNL